MTHASTTIEGKTPLFGNKTYDAIKWTAQYFLPGLGTLYAALGVLWGFPFIQEVVGSVSAVTLFLGALQGVGAKSYNASDAKYDGSFVVGPTPTGNVMRFEVEHDLESLQGQKTVTFKVQPPQAIDLEKA